MPSEPLYLPTPLFYVNAEPHLGHFYVTLVGDVLARFWRARGRTVFTLTGTDEHGDKIAQAAAAAGVTPQAHADRVSALFRSTWEEAGLRYDHFIRTTDGYHVRALEHRGRLDLWPAAHHLIGEDILKQHAIFWPTMLMAAGLPLYRRLCVHGHWQMQAGKMAKSLGNVVRPLAMKARYGMDAF